MDDADRAAILHELPSLLVAVQLTPQFLSQLQRLRVFPPHQLDQLRTVADPRDCVRRLLLDVTQRGPHAFEGLARALLESGQLAAARLLKLDLSLADVMANGGAALPTTPAHPPAGPPPARPPQHHQQHSVDQAGDRPDHAPPQICVKRTPRYMGNPEDTYKMTTNPRGLALVISNVDFPDETEHTKRIGGEVDEAALPALLRQLGFEVTIMQNLNQMELGAAVEGFVKRPEHEAYDAAVLAVLTHGHNDVLYGVDSLSLPVEEVISNFSHDSAPLLAGKPKWLIFQACRGDESNRACAVRDSARQATDGRAIVASANLQTDALPEYSDIFITFSTIPGYVSLRDVDKGSWLVQALCTVFADHAHDHNLSELHNRVHRFMNSIVTSDNEKQTAEDSRRGWRKKLYFNPGR